MIYTLSLVANILKGEFVRNDLSPNTSLSRLAIDSRTAQPGSETLFFAIKGVRHNGHFFVNDLAERGVQVFVVSEPTVISASIKVAIIRVKNTLEALQRLAAHHRSCFSIPVVGITGSNGKTVVKEWLHDLLSPEISIIRSPKSYNSQVGVPLSVWNIQPNHRLAIFEAGISQPGEMAQLRAIIEPQVGIFTNIGEAHQEHFESLQEKVLEKLLLFNNAHKLVYCADQPDCVNLIDQHCTSNGITRVSWSLQGMPAQIQFRLKTGVRATHISAQHGQLEYEFQIPFTDNSSIENCCHCFAAMIALDIDPQTAIPKFEHLSPVAMRLELKKGSHGSLLINDYYNSDINSLEIALSVMSREAETHHSRKIVILSDIHQSGQTETDLYRRVNQLLVDNNSDLLIGIGPSIASAAAIFTLPVNLYPTVGSFLKQLKSELLSQSTILIKGAREFRFEEISSALQQKVHQTVLEINLNRMTDNLNHYRSLLLPTTRIMAMVKAFSYGTGDTEIAKMLQYQRIDYLAVAVADEGVELRNAGITTPIVVMNPEIHSLQLLIDYRLEPNLYDLQLAEEFRALVSLNALKAFPVHIKLDTGMNRLGFKTEEELNTLAEWLHPGSGLNIVSIFSHLAASDDPMFDTFTHEQAQRFSELSHHLIQKTGTSPMRHLLNSAGIERFPEYQFDMVRLGIGLYGVSSIQGTLQPVGRLTSTVSQVKKVAPGETVGYNRAGQVMFPSEIAVIPVGYADGLDRRLSNGVGQLIIGGKRVPIVGNICMDMCMADVTGAGIKPGDTVEIFGDQIPISEMASKAGTIPYEMLTGISQRVKRIYIQE